MNDISARAAVAALEGGSSKLLPYKRKGWFSQSGAAAAAPARKDVWRLTGFKSVQRRGDLKEGISPSFIVSIRGVKRGKKSKSSPSCVVLFPPFSWTSKRKGIVSRAGLRIRSGRLSANGFRGKALGRNRNLSPLVSFSFPLSLGQARERG